MSDILKLTTHTREKTLPHIIPCLFYNSQNQLERKHLVNIYVYTFYLFIFCKLSNYCINPRHFAWFLK